MLCLLPFLSSCASSPPVIEAAVPATEIVRPPCLPGAELMVPPQALAPLGEVTLREAFVRWIDDMQSYQVLRLQMEKLQEFVVTQCR